MNYEIMEADSIEDLKERITFPEGREEYSVFYQGFGYEEIIVVPFEHKPGAFSHALAVSQA